MPNEPADGKQYRATKSWVYRWNGMRWVPFQRVDDASQAQGRAHILNASAPEVVRHEAPRSMSTRDRR